MGLKGIKAKKGISQKEDLLDRAGRAELAANEFRFTQTEERLKKEPIKNSAKAENIHNEVGRKVRDTIKSIGGTLPENLRAEPSIKALQSKRNKQIPGG